MIVRYGQNHTGVHLQEHEQKNRPRVHIHPCSHKKIFREVPPFTKENSSKPLSIIYTRFSEKGQHNVSF